MKLTTPTGATVDRNSLSSFSASRYPFRFYFFLSFFVFDLDLFALGRSLDTIWTRALSLHDRPQSRPHSFHVYPQPIDFIFSTTFPSILFSIRS